MSAFGLQNQRIHKTPIGYIDSAHLDGNDGSGVQPSFNLTGFPSLGSLQVGTAFSLNLEAQTPTFFIDPGSPTSELGFYTVNGTPPAAAGFSIAGGVLSNPCVLTNFGTFRLVAIRNGISVLSPPISYAIAAPAGVDTIAPTVPTGITAVPGSANATIAVAFDPPSDIAPGATAASGTSHVDCLVNGSVASPPSPIVTAPNALAAPTNINIGFISSPGTPAFSQVGKVWTLAAAGTGIAATASEQCLLADFGTFAGARTFIAKLDSYTSSAGTALMGIMLHETAVGGGKFLSVGLGPSNGTSGLYVISRTAVSGTSSQVATQLTDANGHAITGPVYVKLDRNADLKTVTISYALDERGWTLITTQTNAMLSAVHFGVFMTSQSAGTEAIGNVEEVAISNTGRLSCTVNSTVTVPIQLRSVDVAGNQSALSTAITGVPNIITTTGPIKSPSGHWIYVDQGQSFDSQFARTQALVARCPHVVGFQYLWKWANLESPTTPGDYSGNWAAAGQAGFQLVHRFADYLASVGKKMHLNNFSYGGNVGAPNSAGTNFLADQMPAYMAGSPTSPYGPNTAATNGINGGLWQNCYPQTFSNVRSFMRYWVPAVAQRMLALSAAYAAQFDTHPGFGMFSPFSESTLPLSGISFSIAADEAVWLGPNGFFVQMRKQWAHTPLRYWANYLDTYDTMSTYLNTAVANKWLIGGPDTLNDPYDAAFNGSSWAPAWNSTTTYRFGQLVSRSGTNYFCITGNTNSAPPNGNWATLNNGSRVVTADQVWQGRNSDNTVNSNYTRWVGQGAWGADVEPLDLDTSHDDGVNFHHVQHANKLGGNALFWYDLRYNSSNATPSWNRSDSPSPNLLDWIESCAQGGNVNVNGAVAGIALTNQNLYPPTWR